MAQIGKPTKEIYVEPIDIPVPQRIVTPIQAPTQTPQPVGVPA
jgi:hypothetical protein